MYFLTFHMAFEAWIRSENCICSGTAVFYARNLKIKFQFSIAQSGTITISVF